MISSLRGTVLYIGQNLLHLDVGGVGFAIQATPATLAELRVNSEATVHTSLVVREDSLTLFGFADADEREVFDILQSVSGVGPKLALGVLAVFTPDLLRDAVAREDTTALQRVSGIGKKGAQRLILELGTKLGPATGGRPGAKTPGGGTAESDVIDALIGLGWAEREAHEAFAEAHAAFPEGDVATLLRASLQTIGQRR